VIESAGAGTDLVKASVSHALGLNVENLTLTGAAAIDGSGNDLANTIIGNAANNILTGGKGADILTGGAGSDTFVYTGGDGGDRITDFTIGQDHLDLRQAFSGIASSDFLKDGFLKLVNDGHGNTQILIDKDGSAGAGGSELLATLDKVATAKLAVGADIWVV
jgi:Ca2+-binding RTX toxin-like protein